MSLQHLFAFLLDLSKTGKKLAALRCVSERMIKIKANICAFYPANLEFLSRLFAFESNSTNYPTSTKQIFGVSKLSGDVKGLKLPRHHST